MAVALVTGTSSGFGRSTAERLARLGWEVVGTVRDPEGTAAPVGCRMVGLDLRDTASIAAAVADVEERYGRLDALVANAGIAVIGPLEELSIAEVRDQLEVNLVGTLALALECLPALRAARGVIVLVSSVSGRLTDPGFGAYCASKYGLEAVGGTLAVELAPQGVRVVLVEPGPFRTSIGANATTALGRGTTGLYGDVWRELDEFVAFLRDEAEEQELAVDAIVAAATVAGAPLHLPVGSATEEWVRGTLEAQLAGLEEARAFLEAHGALGRGERGRRA